MRRESGEVGAVMRAIVCEAEGIVPARKPPVAERVIRRPRKRKERS